MKYLYFILFIFPLSAFSLVILKTKDTKALIHLQGVRTKQGSYFRIYDLEGNKKGLMKIDKVSQSKAIGTLKKGSMNRKWSLRFVSKKMAYLEMQKAADKREKMALIHREKLKRKIALKREIEKQLLLERAVKRRLARQKSLERERKLLERKRAAQRKLASFQLEDDILEDLKPLNDSSDFNSQSTRQDSYEQPFLNEDKQSQDILSYEEDPNLSSYQDKPVEYSSRQSMSFALGLSPVVQYNFMKIMPRNGPGYKMQGIGGELALQAFVSLNDFIDIGGLLGGRYFYASAPSQECAQDVGCELRVYYLAGALNIKANFLKLKQHKLWTKLEGSLLMPLAYSNKASLTQESFSPIHGTLGGGLGLDLKFGNLVVPISLSAGFYVPPTETIIAGTAGLRTGLLYKF